MSIRERAEEVFEAALELEPDERTGYVARVCAYDPALLRQVLVLLEAHGRAEGVLELDAGALMRTNVEPMPERLGPYRIVREIGRGGMGVVYEAERDDGQFLRRVAIKVLRAGHDPALRQRVLAERQILASLEHSDIARLLDGGVTDDGRPYLVMERVEGLPVDVFCNRMRLSVAERLQLFMVIARAVAYAHRNLVVHRDLKPSNILVTADGQVKLLDFGVAKLLQPTLRGVAPQTLPDRIAFTPEYASPEQLRGDALTTATDIYALGVLLYELLTGARPFAAAGLGPLLQAVAEQEPEPPSTRVLRRYQQPALDGGSVLLEPSAIAHARNTSPTKLARTLRGDLDAIVAMALRKEPQRRYSSAELLVDDVERHLTARPVLAQRRGRAYAMRKLLRRHRTAASALTLALLSLLLGAGAAIWQARAARAERDRADAARIQAEQVTNFMVDMFQAGAAGGVVQGVVTARDLVQRGAARIDELAGQPLVQANMLVALSRAYEGLGDYDAGQRLTQRALAISQAQPQPDQQALAALLLQHGTLQRRRSQFDSAQNTFFAARSAVERVPEARELHGQILLQLASIAVYRGDVIEAERRVQDAYEQQLRDLGETHRATVNALAYLATVQWRRGRRDAERIFRRVIELRPRVADHTRNELLQDRMALATMLVSEAIHLDEAESICRDVMAAVRSDAPEQIGLAVWSRHLLATILEHNGEIAEAERRRREDLAIRLATHDEIHPNTGETLMTLSGFLSRTGRAAEADSLLARAGRALRGSVGERHALYSTWLLESGAQRLRAGDARAADTLVARGTELRAQLSGRTAGPYLDGLRWHALVKIALGQYQHAEQLLNTALELASTQMVEGGRDQRQIHATFAELYSAWGRVEDAARHRAQSLPVPIPT